MVLEVITHNKYKMAKDDKTIFWIIGIIFAIAILQHTGILQQFSIVQQTVCADKTISYWDLEGNVLDSNNINNGINNGGVFINGKIGQAIEFDKNSYVNFPTISSEGKTIIMWIKNYSSGGDWYFASETNGVNKGIIPLNSQFGLGFNGSVDEIAVFSPPLTSDEFATFSAGYKVCYTTSYEENVTCKDYATSQVEDPGFGCLNYSGEFFPSCDYTWEEDITQFKIEDNKCVKQFYCQDPCLESNGCYETNQSCKEDLIYSCYIIQNDNCIEKTDYGTCVLGSDSYNNLTLCQEHTSGISTTSSIGSTQGASTTRTGIKDKLSEEVFTIAGFKVTIFYLIILLLIILAGLYAAGVFK